MGEQIAFFCEVPREVCDFITQISCTLYTTRLCSEKCGGANLLCPPHTFEDGETPPPRTSLYIYIPCLMGTNFLESFAVC